MKTIDELRNEISEGEKIVEMYFRKMDLCDNEISYSNMEKMVKQRQERLLPLYSQLSNLEKEKEMIDKQTEKTMKETTLKQKYSLQYNDNSLTGRLNEIEGKQNKSNVSFEKFKLQESIKELKIDKNQDSLSSRLERLGL